MNAVPGAALALRLAAADDVPALAALYAHTARALGPQVYSADQVRAWQAFGQDTPAFRDYVLRARTWMGEDAKGALGFCGIGADGEVHSLYVRADATRQGGSLYAGHGGNLQGHQFGQQVAVHLGIGLPVSGGVR